MRTLKAIIAPFRLKLEAVLGTLDGFLELLGGVAFDSNFEVALFMSKAIQADGNE